MFVVFFGKSNAYKYDPPARLFRMEFPHVEKLFTIIKRKNNNKLAILLQRIEAHVILDHVADRISKELPNVPFLTIHDSILPFRLSIITSYNEKVKEIMVETIEKITGIKPPGRIKRFL